MFESHGIVIETRHRCWGVLAFSTLCMSTISLSLSQNHLLQAFKVWNRTTHESECLNMLPFGKHPSGIFPGGLRDDIHLHVLCDRDTRFPVAQLLKSAQRTKTCLRAWNIASQLIQLGKSGWNGPRVELFAQGCSWELQNLDYQATAKTHSFKTTHVYKRQPRHLSEYHRNKNCYRTDYLFETIN